MENKVLDSGDSLEVKGNTEVGGGAVVRNTLLQNDLKFKVCYSLSRSAGSLIGVNMGMLFQKQGEQMAAHVRMCLRAA